MSGWNEDNLEKFMSVNFELAEHRKGEPDDKKRICRQFTEKLFKFLDWTQVVETPYVDIRYCGKGDIEKITVKNDFCLSPKQCADIANFVAGRINKDGGRRNISDINTFAVLEYIRHGERLQTDYIGILRRMYREKHGGDGYGV